MSDLNELDNLDVMRMFICAAQRNAFWRGMRGEEAEYFRDKLKELLERFRTMPKTYEQDGLGLEAVAHLHYFTGSGDWYITERDIDLDGEGQQQAFGSANLGYGAELGYISIQELIECGVELDLHFKPCKLSSLAKAVAV